MQTLREILKAPWRRVDASSVPLGFQILDSEGGPALLCYTGNEDADREKVLAISNAVNAATADERGETPFVIWSNEHRAWWGPGERGYTTYIEKAGCYSRARAEAICENAGPTSFQLGRSVGGGVVPAEIMLRLEDARRSTAWLSRFSGGG